MSAASISERLLSQPFKRSQLGLFQGKTKQYGNNVPHSKHKTRRTWLPNVQRKRFFSESLGENVRVKVTTRALKTIKKHNGIDNYVLNTPSKLLGFEGMRIRLMVKDALKKPQEDTPYAEMTEIPSVSIKDRSSKEAYVVTEGDRYDKVVRLEKDMRNEEYQWSLERRRKYIARIVRDDAPTRETARKATEEALDALGPGASPQSVLEYLNEQPRQSGLKRMLGSRFNSNFV